VIREAFHNDSRDLRRSIGECARGEFVSPNRHLRAPVFFDRKLSGLKSIVYEGKPQGFTVIALC
jgi:hypothetical protein